MEKEKQIAALKAEISSLNKQSNYALNHAVILLLASIALHLGGAYVAKDPQSFYRRVEIGVRFFVLATGILMLVVTLIGEMLKVSRVAYLEELEK